MLRQFERFHLTPFVGLKETHEAERNVDGKALFRASGQTTRRLIMTWNKHMLSWRGEYYAHAPSSCFVHLTDMNRSGVIPRRVAFEF
jgi:hypothetical protein